MHESEKWKWSRSVMSDTQRPHGLQPTRLLRPWDFPGKSTGVGCHCLYKITRTYYISVGPWQPSPVFLPGKSHRQKSLMAYSLRGCRVGHDWAVSLHSLYSTGKYTQYLVITYKGKESEKNIYIYVYITESLCCILEINTILWIIPQLKINRSTQMSVEICLSKLWYIYTMEKISNLFKTKFSSTYEMEKSSRYIIW